MPDDHIKTLKNAGLSEKEAGTYLASLLLGPSTAQMIAAKAGFSRPATYITIESLIQKGLMSSFHRDKKRFFNAESPEQLSRILEHEKKQIAAKELAFQQVLEIVKQMQGQDGRPIVQFFEGLEGIQAMRRIMLESNPSEILEFTSLDEVTEYFPRRDDDYRQVFRERFPIKVLYTSRSGIRLQPFEKKVERRFVPFTTYPFSGDVVIFGMHVNLIYYTPKPLGVHIAHEGIAVMLRQMFLLAWQTAEQE